MPDSARHRPLPGWPAVLDEAWAAAYVSLSVTTFRKQVVPDIRTLQLTRMRVGWRRSDLDAWIARKAGEDAALVEANDWD